MGRGDYRVGNEEFLVDECSEELFMEACQINALQSTL